LLGTIIAIYVAASIHPGLGLRYTQIRNVAAPLKISWLASGTDENLVEIVDDDELIDLCDSPCSDADIESGFPILASDFSQELDFEGDSDDEISLNDNEEPNDDIGMNSSASDVISSRVLEDPFHLLKSFNLSKKYGARVAFLRAFLDALLVVDTEDKWALEQALAREQMGTWDDLYRTDPSWLWRRVRRVIPQPEVLHQSLTIVFNGYGRIKDSFTGKELFDKQAWKNARFILKLVSAGKDSVFILIFRSCF
jgi:hypothetical protein